MGEFGVGLTHPDHAHRQSSDDPDTGGNTQPSRGHNSSSIRATDRPSIHTPSSVPSPRDGAQSRDGGSPDFTNPYFIMLIYDGRPARHQVWGDMPVSQLVQDAARIFEFHPPFTSVVLMLFGLQPAILRLGYLLVST